MLDENFIQENIKDIQETLELIKSFKEHKLSEIVSNFHLYGSLRYAFIELIGRAIDINQHIIKKRETEKCPKIILKHSNP